jgi:GntP family gluconate:H+ symporter
VNPAASAAHDLYLLGCVAGTVALLLLLVGRLRLHAALGLSVAAFALGAAAGIPLEKVPVDFAAGVGEMMGHIAIILGMGAILGQLLAGSGAAAALGRALVERCGPAGMPWALMVLGILVGLPVFFEVGLVLLMPVIVDAARRSGRPPILAALPVLAGLSAMHCMLPPHPGALLATAVYHAALAPVMLWGMVVGTFAAVVSGPVLSCVLVALWQRPGSFLRRALPAGYETGAGTDAAIARAGAAAEGSETASGQSEPVLPAMRAGRSAPPSAGAATALVVILLPVVLILAGGWADAIFRQGTLRNRLLHLAGSPDVAMVVAALVALAALGRCVQEAAYHGPGGLRRLTVDSFTPIASPLVILAAAGGLSGVLRASGAAQAAVTIAMGAHLPPLLLAWALAAAVRVSMGSATVALAVASGILAPLAGTMGVRPELLVLATGSGSIMLSHVNDSGFWLVGSLFKIDVKATLATWSAVETVLSLAGLAGALALNVVLK